MRSVWLLAALLMAGSVAACTHHGSSVPLATRHFPSAKHAPFISIVPRETQVVPGSTITLRASSDQPHPPQATWSMLRNASGGKLTAQGVYTAGPLADVTDTVQVVGASGARATAEIRVTSELVVKPDRVAVPPHGSVAFRAHGGYGQYHWTCSVNNSGATIDATSGVYRCGTTSGTVDTVQVSDALGHTAVAVVYNGWTHRIKQ